MAMPPMSGAALYLPGVRDRLYGPLTRARIRRTQLLHLGLCFLGFLPYFFGLNAQLQVLGFGLWFPGAGFIAVGGWAMLLAPLFFLLYCVAVLLWFGIGMAAAPIAIWVGSSLLAGIMTSTAPTLYAVIVIPVLTGGFLIAMAVWRSKHFAKGLTVRSRREALLKSGEQAAKAAATPAPAVPDRALDETESKLSRYLFDRALQPIEDWNGFDKIDQFQLSALRYQLNQLGWALSMLQRHRTPNFHGYLNIAQRNVITKYCQQVVWSYWPWENAWGNFSLDGDPAKKDNVMLTGYVTINALHYMLSTGETCYMDAGSMSFQRSGDREYTHSLPTLIDSIIDNYEGDYAQPYCLYPCEPNWIYPVCNLFALTALRQHDVLTGTTHFDRLQSKFRAQLTTEFIGVDGGILPLRSKLTGHAIPFPAQAAANVKILNPLFPDLAETYWAIAREEDVVMGLETIELNMPRRPMDFGNYSLGPFFVFDSLLSAATEMGDQAIAQAVKAQALEYARDNVGVMSFDASNMANVSIIGSWLNISNGWRDAALSKADISQPILTNKNYPDVLVHHAFSAGEDLTLLLSPGTDQTVQTLTFARLRPGGRYRLNDQTIMASPAGTAQAQVALSPRLGLHLVPVF